MIPITYQRNVDHCEPSQYIKMVTIKEVTPAENSDNLDKVEFAEIGWCAISQRGKYSPGDQVMFIPPESVLPFELTELLEITKYTNKGRIRVTRLRGNRSEGLIVDASIVEPYIPYIMKWEDIPDLCFAGDAIKLASTPIDFLRFYKMPNILNEPFTFKIGEEIWYSEKIHGTNMRFGVLPSPDPVINELVDYVGSHNVVLRERDDNLYWVVYNSIFKGKIPYGYVFFCEAFGAGVQHLTYGKLNPDAKVFAIMHRGEYLPIPKVIEMCAEYDLPVVNFHKMIFSNIEEIRELADAPSEVTDKHFREGIVMVSDENPNRMAKCIGFTYLTHKEKSRTERH